MHKPNKQTIVPHSYVTSLMSSLPLSRVPGFAGKLGAQLEDFGEIKTFADVSKFTMLQLEVEFGHDVAVRVIQVSQGIDTELVKDRALLISIGCGKSFRSKNTLSSSSMHDGTVLKWLRELSEELHERCECDALINSRFAKKLTTSVSIRPKAKSTRASTSGNSSSNISNSN